MRRNNIFCCFVVLFLLWSYVFKLDNLGKIMDLIKQYMKQPSTWRGIFMLLGIAGVSFMPEQKEAIIGAALAALALYETFRNEKNNG